jgi:hypothetical protein
MSKQTYGNGQDAYLFGPVTVANTVARTVYLDLRRFDVVGLQLQAGGGAATLDGAWTISVSNDYTPTQTGAAYGQATNTGTWTDITASALWVDAIAAVAHATASSTNQYMQPKYPIGARHMRIVFTGTTGSATVSIIVFAKSLA